MMLLNGQSLELMRELTLVLIWLDLFGIDSGGPVITCPFGFYSCSLDQMEKFTHLTRSITSFFLGKLITTKH